MSEPIGVVIVDDHSLVREGLQSLLSQFSDIRVTGEAGTIAEAVKVIGDVEPDLVLLDLRLGEEEGVEVARQLRASGSDVTILMLSVHDTSRHLREALAAGADGYLLKSVAGADLAAGIRNAVAGETVIGQEFVPKLLEDAQRGVPMGQPDVTKREQEVLELVAEGMANREIAEKLGISARTAQKHLENLFKKFSVHDRTELVAHAFRRGLLG
ncbi:two component transcriptional regulator, LuxR family [Euzebya pacifica]|uniref:Two component transcriptional regulator, LuxR family n=1 Tax=Euzebya pacifica TaxID=1608957 RepID=A0A346Y2B4_9ACTN|nr:response regulator transcription factor [Euzebya pacifica]AXV08611.1 two component transcriptional regulator, LuxR family [Euzebya pacifica]